MPYQKRLVEPLYLVCHGPGHHTAGPCHDGHVSDTPVPAGLEGVFDNLRMEVSEAEMVGQFDKAGVESDMKLIENDPR